MSYACCIVCHGFSAARPVASSLPVGLTKKVVGFVRRMRDSTVRLELPETEFAPAGLELAVGATPDNSHPASARKQGAKKQDVTIAAMIFPMRTPLRASLAGA